MSKAADMLREGWKEYEQAVQLYNGKKMREWSDQQAENMKTGKYVSSRPPAPKLPSLDDFRYWVWESGDYASEPNNSNTTKEEG